MAWGYLVVAGMLEWGWPLGLKYAWRDGGLHAWPALGAIACMGGSGLFLFLAQRTLPIGTAYAVWTGIGAVGTFALGVLVLREPAGAARLAFVGLIVAGIVGLRLTAAGE